MATPPLLTFPVDYPIKVVGRSGEPVREITEAIIARHAPDYDMTRTSERLSANGNFISISYTIRAVSAEQVTALAAELTSCEAVLLVF